KIGPAHNPVRIEIRGNKHKSHVRGAGPAAQRRCRAGECKRLRPCLDRSGSVSPIATRSRRAALELRAGEMTHRVDLQGPLLHARRAGAQNTPYIKATKAPKRSGNAYRSATYTSRTSMFISSPRGLTTDRIADGVAIAVLLAVTVIAALTFRDYGLGWDDYTHAQYGDLLLKLYSSGFTDRRALSFVNLYAYGGGFDMAAALAAKISSFDLFETRRLVGAIVGI